MNSLLRPLLVLFAFLTLVTGVAYPLVATGVAQALFPGKAGGSLIERDGKVVGSSLIGQHFSEPGYFWGRPSATSPMPYNASATSGSNQGPLNPALIEAVQGRIDTLHDADPGNAVPVPVDLVTASASGVDPHISPAAAHYQVPRIARARRLQADRVRALVDRQVEGPLLGFFGEPRVNVLELNLALERVVR